MQKGKCKREYDPASFAAQSDKIASLLNTLPPSYSDTLKKLMEKKMISVEELAYRSGLTERTVYRHRQGEKKRPPLPQVMALCIGMNLHPVFSFDLLSKAGIRLTSSKEDTVYTMVLMTMSEKSIADVNKYLKAAGVDTLSCYDVF